MRTWPGLVLCCALLPAQTPSDGEAGRVFVELQSAADTFYQGQVIELSLRLGCDREFFAAHAIQPFQQALDVPVQVLLSWRDAPPGATALPQSPAPAPQRRIACDDGTVLAQQLPDERFDGRLFTVLELRFRCVAQVAGELSLPAPRLRFSYTTAFEESLLQGRMPVDRHDITVEGQGRALRILPLPTAGRPRQFHGAVGRFTVHAEARPTQLQVGDDLQVTLHIDGDGNLPLLPGPQPSLPGFHQFGMVEQPSATGRSFLLHLAPLRPDLRWLPAIAWSYFDPTPPGRYRTAVTEPIGLSVAPLPPGAQLAPLLQAELDRARPGENDIFDLLPVGAAIAPSTPSFAMVLAALLAPWVLCTALWALRAARARDRADPLAVRARHAHARCRAALAADDVELLPVLAEYLAAKLCRPGGAVLGEDLHAPLLAAGASPALAAEVDDLLARLSTSRYSGAAADDKVAVTALVDALEAALRTAGRRR